MFSIWRANILYNAFKPLTDVSFLLICACINDCGSVVSVSSLRRYYFTANYRPGLMYSEHQNHKNAIQFRMQRDLFYGNSTPTAQIMGKGVSDTPNQPE